MTADDARKAMEAETDAAYAHVESKIKSADASTGHAPLWHGWALREAFIAGAAYASNKKDAEIARLRDALTRIADGNFTGIALMSLPPKNAAAEFARAALKGATP